MLVAFENYVMENKLFSKQDKLLLAISGGEDSVCLFYLLLKNNYRFSIAHCNFQLRGKESIKDEDFVKRLAKKHKIPIFSIRFDTKKESKKLKKGTQETARILRYDWFYELMETQRFDKLLTAHHLGDNSETMIINLLRSTGISGLHGIPVNHRQIVRPLMFTDKENISRFNSKHHINFRLDKSNLADQYLRNAVRHKIFPALKRIEPHIDAVLQRVSSQVLEFEQLANELIEKEWGKTVQIINSGFRLSFTDLKQISHLEAFLYYKLKDYGFNRTQIKTISIMEKVQVGKKIESRDWELTRDRDAYTLLKKPEILPTLVKITSGTKNIIINELSLGFIKISPLKVNYNRTGTLYLDISDNPFPLYIRSWKKGDRMQPLGMKGTKKISDILTDKKVEHSSRQHQLIIVNKDGNVMALLPEVISETCKVDSETIRVLSIRIKIT